MGGRHSVESTTTFVLEKRLAAWRGLLERPGKYSFLSQGEIERAIAGLEHELARRAAVGRVDAEYNAERTT